MRAPLWYQDLSPGSVEEAEEAEPDDEFKDAIEVTAALTWFYHMFLSRFILSSTIYECELNAFTFTSDKVQQVGLNVFWSRLCTFMYVNS